MSSEKRRLTILVGVLIVAAIALAVDRFVLSDNGTTASPTTDQTAAPATTSNRPANQSPPKKKHPSRTDSDRGYRPLPLQVLTGKSGIGREPDRNVFVYFIPPPPPPPKVEPPPPPPLVIHSVNPRSVFAKTKDFTLRVLGMDLPEEALVFINGRSLKTTYVNGSELSAIVEKRWIAAPGQLQVEVRNSSGELYSNALYVAVQEPPVPIYKYIGRIDNLVYLQKGSSERLVARLGGTIENRWRVAEIGGDNIVLEDVQLGIPHAIPMEGPIADGRPNFQPDTGFPAPQPGVSPIRSRINSKTALEPQQPEQASEEEEP